MREKREKKTFNPFEKDQSQSVYPFPSGIIKLGKSLLAKKKIFQFAKLGVVLSGRMGLRSTRIQSYKIILA